MVLSNLYDDYQFNEPSRADYYAMQVAQYVKLANSKKGARVKLTDMEIKRQFRERPQNVEEATEVARKVWRSRLPGLKGL